ncbi:MAG: class I SAM-dependent methyltransferase [Candidatus Aminicenantales bacterium]
MTGRFLRAEACPICRSREIRPWKKGTFDYAALSADQIKITDSGYGKIWDLSACGRCGHIFADPYPSPDFIFSLYGEVEDPLYDQEAAGRAKNFVPILNRLDELCPDHGILFDVGAATGILGDAARNRGWRVDGVDPSSWAVRRAALKYGLTLRESGFEDVVVAAGSCRAVTMIDFIEHTPRPVEAVAKAFALLAPSGVLCLVTPDIHSRAARLAGRRWWHLRPGHLAYYSKESLRVLLEEAGFRILECRRYAWTFSLHYLVSRFRWMNGYTRSRASSFLRRIPIKLALGDSFEIYAVKDRLS